MQTLIITGAAGSIGRAAVAELASPERHLVCIDLATDRLQEIIKGLPGSFQLIDSNLGSTEECTRIVNAIDGAIAGLVHLAGSVEYDTDINADVDLWDRVINSNLRNAYDLCGAMESSLANTERPAKLVFATSLAYRRGSPEFLAYGASKGGLVGFIRSYARRLGAKATVNAVAPGIIETPMTTELIENHGERLLGGIALQRFGQPQDVAKVISFLVSPESDYVTGQVINIDGGMAYN